MIQLYLYILFFITIAVIACNRESIATTTATTSQFQSKTKIANNYRDSHYHCRHQNNPKQNSTFFHLSSIPRGGGLSRGIVQSSITSNRKRTHHDINDDNHVIETLQEEVIRLRTVLNDNGIMLFDEHDRYDKEDKTNEIMEKEDGEVDLQEKSPNNTNNTIDNNNSNRNNQICSYIQQILNERFHQVITKQRSKWFAKHYKKKIDCIDGEYTIVSFHGREEGNNVFLDHNDGKESQHLLQSKEQEKIIVQPSSSPTPLIITTTDMSPSTIFPQDLQSLDIVYTEKLYNQAIKEIKQKQIKELSDHHSMYEQESFFKAKLFFRALQLGWNFTPVMWTLAFAAYSKSFRDKVWYNLVGRCLAKSGPAFIKWGQWASTRSDMFPDTLCQALSELHADAPAHSWKITQSTVEEALCIPKGSLFEVFEEFDHNPVASGSIAQVHRAVLRSNYSPLGGSSSSKKSMTSIYRSTSSNCHDRFDEVKGRAMVAIKVRHPNVSRLIDMDFRLMSYVADIADRIPSLSWLRVRDSVEQFSHTMAAQAHLNVEAHHLEVLNYNFRKWDTVQFPRPLFACSSVIIETFEKGEICTNVIDRYDDLAKSTYGPIVEEVTDDDDDDDDDKRGLKSIEKSVDYGRGHGYELMPVPLAKFIVTTGLSMYLKMLLVDNLMHADLHPGNIMLDVQIGEDKYGDTTPVSNLGADVPIGGASSDDCDNNTMAKYNHHRTKRRDSSSSKSRFYGQITLVDAGMVAQLDNDESMNFIGLISALGEGDGRAAAEAVMRFNNNNKNGELNNETHVGGLSIELRENFIEDMILLFEERCQGYGTNVDFGNVLRGVLGIVKKHRIQLGANYATLIVNALCLDGLAKRVCPSYNLLDASKPLLKAYRALRHNNNESDIKKGFLKNRPKKILKLKQTLIKAATPFLYMKKRQNDNKIFREIQLKREGMLILEGLSHHSQ